MRRMSRGVVDLQGPAPGRDRFATLQLAEPLAGNGQELSPQPVHVLAVQARRAREQFRRVREMRRAALVNEHVNRRVFLGETTGAPGMVQVDMGQQDLANVRYPDTAPLQG